MIVLLLAYLLLASAVGFMLTFVSRMPWQLEGRVAAGVVLGISAAALLTWLAAIPLGMSGGTVLVGAVLLLITGATCARFTRWRTGLRNEWTSMLQRWRNWQALPLAMLVGLALVFFVPFYTHALEVKPDGLYAGYVNIWGDWCTHLAIAGYLSEAHHLLPPDNPFFSGVKLTYPFLPDFFSGVLLHLGLGLEASLPLASGIMSLALVVLFYSTAQRLGGDRWAAAAAVLVFFLSGGLGFLNLLHDLHPEQPGALGGLAAIVSAIVHPMHACGANPQQLCEYTLDRSVGFQWLNPVLAYLVPQRSTLFGFALGLIVVSIAWYARGSGRRGEFVVGGVLLGLLPLLHASSYFDLALFFSGLAALDVVVIAVTHRDDARSALRVALNWMCFLVPAAVIGAPQVLLILPPAAYNRSFLHLQLGWLSVTSDYHLNVVFFWLLNTALLIPLALMAYFLGRGGKPGLMRFVIPAWLLFILPNLVILQPWDWDNTKWFAWWAIFAAILAGVVVAQLGKRGPVLGALAILLLLATTASGGLDLVRASQRDIPGVSYRLLTTDELRVAEWARSSTPESSIFLTGWQNNHPILTMSRREVVMGYPGWIWTWGLNDDHRQADVVTMYRGMPGTDDLLHKYRVTYVVIGPEEMDAKDGPGANLPYWQSHHRVVFQSQDYEVFSVA
ncbi:MAG: hypothetical protein ACR2MY_11205 [Candidatus Dormibacteria bacterium]